MAIDRDRIIDVVYGGNAAPIGSVLPPGMTLWANQDLQPVAFDPDAANDVGVAVDDELLDSRDRGQRRAGDVSIGPTTPRRTQTYTAGRGTSRA